MRSEKLNELAAQLRQVATELESCVSDPVPIPIPDPDPGPAPDVTATLRLELLNGAVVVHVQLSDNLPCQVAYREVGELEWLYLYPENSSNYGRETPHRQVTPTLPPGQYQFRAYDHINDIGGYSTGVAYIEILAPIAAPPVITQTGSGKGRYVPDLQTHGDLRTVFRKGFVYRNGDDRNVVVGDGILDQRFAPTRTGSVHEQGSARISSGFRQYTVSQRMMFSNRFDPVRGGKCGFSVMGKGALVSGGSTAKEGWSTRLMWRPSTKPAHIKLVLYTYQYNREFNNGGAWGDDNDIADIPLGEWADVKTAITLNSHARAADGRMQAWVNGVELLDKSGVQWQAAGTPGDHMHAEYTAFFGGNDASWAPKTVEQMWIRDVVYEWSNEIT